MTGSQQSLCAHDNHTFLLAPPYFLSQVFYCKIKSRSITPDKPGPYRQKAQRSKGDLIFKTLLYIMHMDHTFLNHHSKYMAMVLCNDVHLTCARHVLPFGFALVTDCVENNKQEKKDHKHKS